MSQEKWKFYYAIMTAKQLSDTGAEGAEIVLEGLGGIQIGITLYKTVWKASETSQTMQRGSACERIF